MWRILISIIFALVTTVGTLAQTAEQFTGKLAPDLVPDMVHVYQRLYSPPKPGKMPRMAVPAEKGAVISAGELIDQRVPSAGTPMLLVEPPEAAPYLWIDANANGVLEKAERFTLKSSAADSNALSVVLRLPIKNVFYKDFPVYVEYRRGFRSPRISASDRLILQSVYALALGKVEVGGRGVIFQYPFQPQLAAISTTEGLFGVDVDGDGRIRDQQFSVESAYAAKEEIVFPLGDIFVSTSVIDMATGKINVRRRSADEYTRVDLEVGTVMPDFTFTDLEGKTRTLMEFRGKYLLIDFWGVWCADCLRETPYHVAAYERFKGRGFEILGLNTDDNIETLRSYIKKNKMNWPQATHESIKRLANVTYRIQEYPSTILLGPDGRVLVIGQDPLRGDELLQTLDRILPRQAPVIELRPS